MNSEELKPALQIRATVILGGIFFLRMFGLFLLIPVLSLYTLDLAGATPVLIGMALGIYGLTQGLLQIPLGILSDRFGRKPVIVAGLGLFIIGSLVAAAADHIHLVILGRALQGAGAIAAAIMALLADVSSEQYRTRAMAGVGMSVGLAFILAMVLGPVLGARIGLDGLFYLGAVLAAAAIAMLFLVPAPFQPHRDPETGVTTTRLAEVLRHPELLRFNLGVLFLHMILMATFVALPLVLRDHSQLDNAQHWYLYLPVLLVSILLMLPMVLKADRKEVAAGLYPVSVVLLLISQLGLSLWHRDLWSIALFMLFFFVAFNYLEASLPASVSKSIAANRKGSALGVFATAQFIGAFIGGLVGGLSLEYYGYTGVFICNSLIACVWLACLAALKTAVLGTRLDHLPEN